MIEPPAPGLYVHIPFCAVRCDYCDFVSGVYPPDMRGAYLDCLGEELHRASAGFREPFRTVYVGGGSPSSLSLPEWDRLWAILAPHTAGCVECTVEMNPSQVSAEKLDGVTPPVTRVSLGVQTWQPALREVLGRQPTDTVCVSRALELVRGRFDTSIDLMHSIPGQTMHMLDADLDEVERTHVDHVSAYALTVEEGTALAGRVERGELRLPGQEFQADALVRVRDRLAGCGYVQYEISNFARPGHECLHNAATWAGLEYLGVGAGASSHIDGERCRNAPEVPEYVQMIRASGSAVVERERLDARRRAGELAMLGLRTRRGIDVGRIAALTGLDPWTLFAGAIERHTRAGLLEVCGACIRLTERGLDLADRVGVDFIV